MSAVASSAGVISATAPGGIPISAPYTPDLTGSDGALPQPWYSPTCSLPGLLLSTHKIVAPTPTGTVGLSALLLDSDDFDISFTVDYSTDNGAADDVQMYFRADACASNADRYNWATEPNGGNTTFTIFQFIGSTPTAVSPTPITDAAIAEGTTVNWRVHVYGTTCDTYLNGTLKATCTISALTGHRTIFFILNKVGTKLYNIALS